MKFFAYLVLAITSFQSWGYIPDFRTILSRTADNHGQGLYEIDQDVIFRTPAEPIIIREVWTVDGSDLMRVQISGRGTMEGLIQLSLIYKNDRRHHMDAGNQIKSSPMPNDWFEPFFNFRNSKNLRSQLVALNILPGSALSHNHFRREKDKYTYNPSTFLRLSRTGGYVAYAFGTPSQDANNTQPGLWIEQDQFVVRKLRLPSKALIQAEEYSRYASSLWLAKRKLISWGNNLVEIKVNSVKSLGRPKGNSSFDVQQLKPSSQWPEQALVREFYTHFR